MVVSAPPSAAGASTLEAPAYSYSAKPQAVPTKRSRPRYKADEGVDNPPNNNNIMYDRRVVRGNTYQAQVRTRPHIPTSRGPTPCTHKATCHSVYPLTQFFLQNVHQVVTSAQQREAERLQKEQAARLRREQVLRRRAEMNVPHTPPAVYGRQHMDAQTDDYLEELTDRPVEKDADTQTQSFLDRPPSPLFVPAKCGVDRPTQIEHGDLFDFNTEVVPLLEVLVGKTLEVRAHTCRGDGGQGGGRRGRGLCIACHCGNTVSNLLRT